MRNSDHRGRSWLSRPKAPYFYRFSFGDANVSVVSDGPLDLGPPGAAFLGLTEPETADLLDQNFLPRDRIVLEQNVLVVEIGGRTILFETGMGQSTIFGPRTGRLQKSLAEAGIDPADVDAVVCSHAHIDHIGGLCDAQGKPAFPNARVFLSEIDFHDWTDEGRLSSAFGVQIEMARRNLLPLRDRIVFIGDGQEILPGIRAVASPGHTHGHHCFIVTAAGQSFCHLGDLTHHQILLCERPLTEFRDDSDPKQAVASRLRILGMVADARMPVMSYHYPWPGFGHIVRNGDGFRYMPAPMELDPVPTDRRPFQSGEPSA